MNSSKNALKGYFEDQRTELAEILAELDHRKSINPLAFHELMPMQQKFKEDPSLLKFLFGGNRSGKSEEAADEVLTDGLGIKHKIWVCGETFQDSIAIQQKKIYDLVPRNRIRYGYFDVINGFRNRKLLLDNGTLYTFKSYDQGPGAFASDDIDLIWNDEEPPYDIIREQRMRLLDRNGRMIITMTSLKGITDLIEEMYEGGDVIESQYAELVNEELPRIVEKNGCRFYMLWTTENEHVNQERVKFEANLMPTNEVKSRIYGIPANLSGKIYPKFNRNVHVVKWADIPAGNWTLFNVLDPHDRKPWAIIWIAVHETGTAYVVDEYPNRNFNEMLSDDKVYEEYATLIKDKEKRLEELFGTKVFRRIIDPNFGNKTVQLAERMGGQSKTTPKKELERRGLNYIDGIDALEAGHLKVREWLHWDKKGEEIIYHPKLLVLDECHNTVTHLSRYSRKDIEGSDGDVKDKVQPMDKHKDFCDCVRYGVMSGLRFCRPQKIITETKKAY